MKNILTILSLFLCLPLLKAQVNLKKLNSPCDCVDQATKYSEGLIKDTEKEDEAFLKQNLIDHYEVDIDLIVEYCDSKYNMNEEVKNCKDFDQFKDLMNKVNALKGQVENELKDTPYDRTYYGDEAYEDVPEEVEETQIEEIDEEAVEEVETDNGFNPYQSAEEYCACADLEKTKQDRCHKKWVEKYKTVMTDGTANRAQGEVLGRKMAECDPDNAMRVLKMFLE